MKPNICPKYVMNMLCYDLLTYTIYRPEKTAKKATKD